MLTLNAPSHCAPTAATQSQIKGIHKNFKTSACYHYLKITKSTIPTTRNSSASIRVGCSTSSEKHLQLRKDSKETNHHTAWWSQSAPWFCWNHSLLTLYYKRYTQKGWDLGVATSPIRSAISKLLVMLLMNWWFVTTQKRGNMLGKKRSLIPFVTKLEKAYNFRYCFQNWLQTIFWKQGSASRHPRYFFHF